MKPALKISILPTVHQSLLSYMVNLVQAQLVVLSWKTRCLRNKPSYFKKKNCHCRYRFCSLSDRFDYSGCAGKFTYMCIYYNVFYICYSTYQRIVHAFSCGCIYFNVVLRCRGVLLRFKGSFWDVLWIFVRIPKLYRMSIHGGVNRISRQANCSSIYGERMKSHQVLLGPSNG